MQLLQAERDALLKPLATVTGIVERRHTLPILSNVLIRKDGDALSFTGTDLEIQISSRQAEGFSGDDFAITVAAKKLSDILRAIADKTVVSMEEADGRLTIKAGKSRFNLQTLPAADFPQLAVDTNLRATIRMPQGQLKALLGRTQFTMAHQDIRYYLNGLFMVTEGNLLKLVATDGHRLAFASAEIPGDFAKNEVILPRKTILELYKLLADSDDEVTIDIASNQVRFAFGNIVIHSKVVDGKFPDYNRVIPQNNDKGLLIERQMLLASMQRAAILSNEKFRGVRLVLTDGLLKIMCNNNEQEEAQEEVEVDYSGAPLDIGFNIQYLLDVLTNTSVETLHFSFGDVTSSVLVTIPDNEHFKYIVMPMRI
ncbi:DNA polymerase III subunit beta [Iodobacter fluviatilis]|jgi:DNA polymerase-3 subunit beta|uniref:Beta sliding clamp n=1 Tax=Iodobacter fluviatilis TaxID=537 RepID=A0A7G3G9T2_9NEIS|nr:DNA polymerase III subunit beta [Iodobacter fluviatilis]QBC43832.1 DNA polymerase III subunit beta [Iodobacter fluviatilis]